MSGKLVPEGRLLLNCQKATRLISESQERHLSLQENLSLKMHLMLCTLCKNFRLQVPFLSEIMRTYARGALEHQNAKE